MIGASLRTIVGRRGTLLGGTAVVLAAVLVVISVRIVIHALRPGRNPSTGGQDLLDGTFAAVLLLGVVVAILIGSLAGSYDTAQGTMRYLVMTGARRGQIYAARTAALLLAVLAMLAPAVVVAAAASLLLPHGDSEAVTAGEVGDLVWTSVSWSCVFAVISMGIGSLLRSNGPAIAISLVFFLGIAPLMLLIDTLSPGVGDLMLLDALDRITGADEGAPLALAAVAVVAWVGVFWVAGRLRVQRDEY